MKKRILALTLVISMVISLVACGQQEADNSKKDDSTVSDASTEGVTINYAYWADNDEYAKLMEDIIAEFNSTNESGITVVGNYMNWEDGAYTGNILTQKLGGDTTIDCAAWKLSSTPAFVANDLLVDLTDMVDAWEDKDDIDDSIYQAMKEAGQSDSAMYVMPWNIQVLYVYYIKSIFKEAGIENVPETYDELLEDIAKCTIDRDGDGKTDVYGWALRGAGGHEPWASFVYGAGGSFDDLTSEASVKGMQNFIDIYEKGYTNPDCVNWGLDELKDQLMAKTSCMTVHHTGSYSGLVDALGDDLGVFPFPAGDGRWTSMGDTDNVIFTSCQNPEAAFEWLTFLATGKGQEMWCKGTGNIPVSNRVGEDEFFQSNDFMKASIDSIGFAGIVPINENTDTWRSEVWGPTVQSALLGQISAEEAMKTMKTGLFGE